MRNLAFAQPEIYDTAYDVAEQKEAAREEAREQIINELRDVGVVRLSNSNVLELEDALRERLVFTDAELDKFISCQVEL